MPYKCAASVGESLSCACFINLIKYGNQDGLMFHWRKKFSANLVKWCIWEEVNSFDILLKLSLPVIQLLELYYSASVRGEFRTSTFRKNN